VPAISIPLLNESDCVANGDTFVCSRMYQFTGLVNRRTI
jgi:hypothetical protein